MRAKTTITGELSLQEHLEKAWGWSYSCLDSGQHSQSEPKLEMGAILVFALSLLPERPILNFLLIFDRYVHSVLQTEISFSFKKSSILKEYKIQKTIVNVYGILFNFNTFHLVNIEID